jgi:preprotein translocase subunit SecF
MKLPNIYEGKYSLLIILPVALVLISLIFAPNIPYGIDLKGGTLITLQLNEKADENAVSNVLQKLGVRDFSLNSYTNPAGNVLEIEMVTHESIKSLETAVGQVDNLSASASDLETTLAQLRTEYAQKPSDDLQKKISDTETSLKDKNAEIRAQIQSALNIARPIATATTAAFDLPADATIKKMNKAAADLFTNAQDEYRNSIIIGVKGAVSVSSYSFEEVSPTLSKFFIEKVIGIAFVSALVAFIIIFFIFRTPLPILVVLSGATGDIMMCLGAMGIFGIPMTLASFSALMMVAGLSLDTDMMLTIKVLKRTEGTPRERAYSAFSTGFAMTTTTLAGFGTLFLLGVVTHIPVYFQIGAVGVIGLIGDLIATWGCNAVLALWFIEGKFERFKHVKLVNR